MIRRISTYLYLHPKIVLMLLLGAPMLWMLGFYLTPLGTLLVNSFYHLDGFTGKIVHQFSLLTYRQLLEPANREILLRTVSMAMVVTLVDAILAFPLSFFMARFATTRMKTFLYLAITLPLWSSYLVRVYSWKLILAKEGILTWFVSLLHLNPVLAWLLRLPTIGGPSLSLSQIGIGIVFTYVWLPYMILPIQTALERVPRSLVEASGDLGARPGKTFWKVILPLSFPGVIAGSIFTFSLTMGDFIVPLSLGNSSFYIGQAVLSHQGTSGNIPLAAAFTMGPIVIMIIYLLFAKRLGAFDAL
jgi:putative spermidine/putrescine transport system permease protein